MKKPTTQTTLSTLIALGAWLLASTAQAAICRVATDGNAANDGSSWAAANTTTVAAALANSNGKNCTEIWLKQGTYDNGSQLTISRNLALYGGFAGTETLRSERATSAALTVLSGGGTHRVLYLDGGGSHPITASTVIDGLAIRSGSANNGAGLYCSGTNRGICSPNLSNVTFSGNVAVVGGAMYNDGNQGTSSPSLSHVVFSGNSATNTGGAMVNVGPNGTSSPTLSHVTFSGNSSVVGGAMYNDGYRTISRPSLAHVTFSGNSAEDAGGAMYNHGSMGNSSPSLTNVTFSGNSAARGGAIVNEGSDGISSPSLTNVTFSGNWAASGGTIASYDFDGASSPSLTNVIVWGNGSQLVNAGATPSFTNSIVQGGCPAGATCTAVSGADPLLGPLQDNGGPTSTMLPAAGSPALNAGVACPATDQRGVARPQGGGCDIGAVERVDASYALRVSVLGTGTVSSVAGDIHCTSSGGVCGASFDDTTQPTGPFVVLNATSGTGSHFTGWGTDCAAAGTTPTTTVTLDQVRSCSATFALNTHGISGTMTGLAGSGLALQLSAGALTETLNPASGATSFAFTSAVPFGTPYTVTGSSQPSGPAQTCTVANGSSTLPDADVTNIQIHCTTVQHSVTMAPTTGLADTTPPLPLDVEDGTSVSMTLNPQAGYTLLAVTGCGGSLSGQIYTTGPITADCVLGVQLAPPQVQPVPTLSQAMLATLALLMVALAWLHLRGRIACSRRCTAGR